MHKRAFTLVEMLVVCAVLALLAALLAGAYGRYRNNLNLVQACQRLSAEIINTQQQARSSGQLQTRGGITLNPTSIAPVTINNVRGTPQLQIWEQTDLYQNPRCLNTIYLLDDSMVQFSVTAVNLPYQPLNPLGGDTGLVMVFGVNQSGSGPFQALFTILFNPDGTLALPAVPPDNTVQPARIILDNGIYKRQIEISKLGKVKEQRL